MVETLQSIGGWAWYVVWAALLFVASLLVYVGLGGNFVLVGLALVHALVTGFDPIGWPLLAVLLGLALLGELVEFILGNFYVLKKGASGWATAGGFAGGLLGAILGNTVVPLIGAVLGSFVGAFLGSVAGEYWRLKHLDRSLQIGWHAFVGRMLAIAFKHACGLVMVLLILYRTLPVS